MHQGLLLKSEKCLTFSSFEKHILKYWFRIADNRGIILVYFFIDFSNSKEAKNYTHMQGSKADKRSAVSNVNTARWPR